MIISQNGYLDAVLKSMTSGALLTFKIIIQTVFKQHEACSNPKGQASSLS